MKITEKRGMIILAIWLILTGLIPILHLSFNGSGVIMAVLAIVAGIMILLE